MMIGGMMRAFGVYDVAPAEPKFKELRFQMIEDSTAATDEKVRLIQVRIPGPADHSWIMKQASVALLRG